MRKLGWAALATFVTSALFMVISSTTVLAIAMTSMAGVSCAGRGPRQQGQFATAKMVADIENPTGREPEGLVLGGRAAHAAFVDRASSTYSPVATPM